MTVKSSAQASHWRILIGTGLLTCSLTLTACFDNDNKSSKSLTPEPEPAVEVVMLTGLIDRIFQQDANAEPESLDNIEIQDNADAQSFTYLLQ